MEKIRKYLEQWKSDIQMLYDICGLFYRLNKPYIFKLIGLSLNRAVITLFNIVLPKYIIDAMLNMQGISSVLVLVGILIGGNFFLELISRSLQQIVTVDRLQLVKDIDLYIGQKIMRTKYENIENAEVLDLRDRTLFALKNQDVVSRVIDGLIGIGVNIFTIIGLVVIIAQLNAWLIALILGIVICNSALFGRMQKLQFDYNMQLVPINRKMGYYAGLVFDFSMGKDLRVYHMAPFLLNRIRQFNKQCVDNVSGLFKVQGRYIGFTRILVQIQMLFVYIYVVLRVVAGEISIGDFSVFTSSCLSFSETVAASISIIMELQQMCRYFESYMEFDELISITGDEGSLPIDAIEEIEFKDVSFHYPANEEMILDHVSIQINTGESLSIVGLNGAGKTTFIKLIAHLYESASGQILVNGRDISEYDRDAYMKAVSAIFQDYKLFAFTLKENIAFDNVDQDTDDRVIFLLEEVGLSYIYEMKNGLNTSIYKLFDKEGVEFSGGESQKIAIARALYKDSSLIIMDEPTAALDPVSEYEIFCNFDRIMNETADGSKMVIMISHRLSSSRLCDHIAVFDQKQIVQYGSHEELLKEDNGLYSQMWSAQSKYYKQDAI